MRRIVLGVVGATLLLGLVVHLPPVMRYLAAHGHHGAGVCPFGYGRPASRVASATTPEPALGFTLGVTTAAEVQRWALLHQVACTSIHRGGELECTNLPSAALGARASEAPAATLWFTLDDANVIRAIRTTRRGPTVAPIVAMFDSLATSLEATRGAPTARTGSSDPEALSSGALRQAMVEFQDPHYRATLRATNMGDGFVLTEQYVALN